MKSENGNKVERPFIGSVQFGDKIIVEANQESTYIDIWVHGDKDFSFGSRKSGNKISVNFGRNVDDKITMNPLRAIRSPCPNVTRTKMRKYNVFGLVIKV